jgi:hypothetical protein
VQEAVLGQWGVTVISGGGGKPGLELVKFLSELKDRVATTPGP